MTYRVVGLTEIPQNHPVVLFSAYWFEAKGTDFVPLRSAVDPMKIPAIIPWVLLLERVDVDGVVKFRYRLTGTGCRTIFDIDYTGKFLGEGLTPDGAEARLREFREVSVSGNPIYSSSHLPIAEREYINVYRGVFPVSLTGAEIDQIFVVVAKEDMALQKSEQKARPVLGQLLSNMR
ncbi:MAG: PAS domain-containing protein [Parvibaculum sp.]|nr:PAS domain-containing protein [Parvibaculum sp.]